jgi:hypothetical protein
MQTPATDHACLDQGPVIANTVDNAPAVAVDKGSISGMPPLARGYVVSGRFQIQVGAGGAWRLVCMPMQSITLCMMHGASRKQTNNDNNQ